MFCSRETLRKEGEDFSFDVFSSLLSDLRNPEIIRLNYSGESGNYPELLDAIRIAKSTSAHVEMVTSLVSTPISVVERLPGSGIDRISISCHTLDTEQFGNIYGAGSLDQLLTRIRILQKARGLSPHPCVVDFAAVVMRENVHEIQQIASLAAALGAPELSLHPVIRRPGVPYPAVFELLGDGSLTEEFQGLVDGEVETARAAYPDLAISIARPLRSSSERCSELLERPSWCEQNPFETAHVLANGDVVPCEVLDRQPLGNLGDSSFSEIWNGPAYTSFRDAYTDGSIKECRRCIFRQPSEEVGPLTTAWGWYPRDASGALWSRIRSSFWCHAMDAESLVIRGLLPPGPNLGQANGLSIYWENQLLARVENRSRDSEEFEVTVPVKDGDRTQYTTVVDLAFSPWRQGISGDSRTLGFALYDARAGKAGPHPPQPGEHAPSRRIEMNWKKYAADILVGSAKRSDLLEPQARRQRPRSFINPPSDSLSVVVPERGSPDMLDECLTSLRRALGVIAGTAEVIVVVNGMRTMADYSGVRRRHSGYRFLFDNRPLGFSSAISRALRSVTSGWTYLLNSDALMEEEALSEALRHRATDVFSVASRIVARHGGPSKETNYTAIQLIDGLVSLIELEPPPGVEVAEHAYSGGGSSLFQTCLLRSLARRTKCYDPFYWEDAEWGVAARSLGLRSLFAPGSRVQHIGRATVSRFYRASEVERIFERNRIQFQLRCLSGVDLDPIRTRIMNSTLKTVLELFRRSPNGTLSFRPRYDILRNV